MAVSQSFADSGIPLPSQKLCRLVLHMGYQMLQRNIEAVNNPNQ
jgi:hypothetical protein